MSIVLLELAADPAQMRRREMMKDEAMLKQVTFATSLLLAMQGTAFAEAKLPDRTVAYGDLDLSNPADVRVFDRRLTWAIMSACPDDRGVGARRSAHACRAAKRAELRTVRDHALAAANTRNEMIAAKH